MGIVHFSVMKEVEWLFGQGWYFIFQGDSGTLGETGVDGDDGAKGPKGDIGAPGLRGQPGTPVSNIYSMRRLCYERKWDYKKLCND